jgi:hypothetical protein
MAQGTVASTTELPISATLVKPALAASPLNPTAASLGRYVEVTGAGFVGAAADEVTLLHFFGTFRVDGTTDDRPVDLKLVPAFVSGTHARYVLDQTDALGKLVDLRRVSGSFTGTVEPIVRKGSDEVTGEAVFATLQIAPVKQVVWVKFFPSYSDSPRLYGLLVADDLVRQRILRQHARQGRWQPAALRPHRRRECNHAVRRLPRLRRRVRAAVPRLLGAPGRAGEQADRRRAAVRSGLRSAAAGHRLAGGFARARRPQAAAERPAVPRRLARLRQHHRLRRVRARQPGWHHAHPRGRPQPRAGRPER